MVSVSTEGSKVEIRSLPTVEPPIPLSGGRIYTASGEMARIVNGQTFSFAAYIEFQLGSKKLRGNHYHSNKVETLYIMTGVLHAVYFDLDSHSVQEVVLSAGDIVTIQPRCAHAYYPVEYSQAIELAVDPYDAGDTVLYDLTDKLSTII